MTLTDNPVQPFDLDFDPFDPFTEEERQELNDALAEMARTRARGYQTGYGLPLF